MATSPPAENVQPDIDLPEIVFPDGSRRSPRADPLRGLRRDAARACGAVYRRVQGAVGSWGDGSGDLIAPRPPGGDPTAGRDVLDVEASRDYIRRLAAAPDIDPDEDLKGAMLQRLARSGFGREGR